MTSGKEKSVDDILAIKDLRTAFCVAKEMGVDMAKVTNLEEAKDRLIKHLPLDPNERPDLASAFQEHQQARQTLFQKYQAAYKFFKELQPSIQKRLEESFPNIDRLFSDRQESLNKGECTILVAGEVGAGKSSLINLLLGVQLFPTDALRCTNTICEIRSSEGNRKEAIAYYKPKLSDSGDRQRRVAPKIIHLGSLKGIQEFKDCVVERHEDDNNPYDRIEVYWPFEKICKGLVIVDTPGIESGSNVDQNLDKYLSKAFGFIYVINTPTAGGVQQGRLGSLLRHVVNSSEDFDPDASIFIGNKWEQIPEQDKKDVMEDTFMKLSQVYPGIRSKQVHYMSIKTAHQVSMKHERQTKEYKDLMQTVNTLIPNSLRHGMTSNYWWLTNFLKRANYVIHVTSVQHEMTREQLEKQRLGLKERVEKLQRNTDENIQQLREKVDYESFRITKSLTTILNSKEILDILCDWSVGADCPRISSKWKRTADEAAVKIADKITRTVDGWERQNRILQTIDNKIVDVFSREFSLVEDQVKELEDALLKNRVPTINVRPIKEWWSGKKKKKEKIERTYTTLGGAVSCIGMLDTSKKEVKKIFKDINERNRGSKMAEASMLFLESILTHKDLTEKLRKFFSKFLKDIDEAAKRIPQFLQADQKLIETISQKLVDITSTQLTNLSETCHDLSGGLDIFFVNELMRFDYDLSEIEWKMDSLLGTGSFADVHRAVLKRKKKPVALKVCREAVKRQNVSDILTEDRIMRDLKHQNVVKYYGATYRRLDKKLYWIIIMDICDTTLKHIYTSDNRDDRDVPGLCGKDHPNWQHAVMRMINHALQIFQGLKYIHERGYTHRDMKLENVLKVKDVIKITDVGVAKQTNMLSVTLNGSPAYMAPEVFLANQSQTNKIDIYSTSFMCWEMWFGRDIAEDMNRDILGFGFQGNAMELLRKRQSDPEKCFRPSLSLANKPPDSLINLLERGWAYDPEKRPTAGEIVNFFSTFLKNN